MTEHSKLAPSSVARWRDCPGYGLGEKLEITIWDDAGNVVVHEFADAFHASQDQIDLAVSMIMNGSTAHRAMTLAMTEPKP